ncbi:MAG: cell division protein ZapA [Bdellovibrio sp. CG10_big_fil_rev_8_21_14_0_10_47_8]|nr:MAG: cell division protein ZapA [Bdellovibrio sp. CG10_big_fil_rev_8_21_14_0_10_47_8]
MSGLNDKKAYEFQIAGLPYRLKSSHDEQTVNELVQFVDQKMKQAMATTKSGSFQSAAVLAALNIAEELLLLRKRTHRELDILEERAMKLAQDLENSKVSKQGMAFEQSGRSERSPERSGS